MTKTKFTNNPFHLVIEGNLVKVWLGKPEDPESEFVMDIDRFWLPSLIEKLRSVK